MAGSLAGKFASVFVSTGTPGGGQEATVMNSLSTLSHHGIVFVPLGYKTTFAQLANLDEVHGGKYIDKQVRADFLIGLLWNRLAMGSRHFRWSRWFSSAHRSRTRDCFSPRKVVLGNCFAA